MQMSESYGIYAKANTNQQNCLLSNNHTQLHGICVKASGQ